MGDEVGLVAGGFQGLGEFGEVGGHFAGDIGGAFGGIERGGVGPDEAEALADFRVGEIGEAEAEVARVGKREIGRAHV